MHEQEQAIGTRLAAKVALTASIGLLAVAIAGCIISAIARLAQ